MSNQQRRAFGGRSFLATLTAVAVAGASGDLPRGTGPTEPLRARPRRRDGRRVLFRSPTFLPW